MIGGSGGGGEGILSLGVIDMGAAALIEEPEGEQVGLDGADLVHAPGGVGQGLGEMGFGGALRLVLTIESLGEFEIGGEVFGSHEDDLSGEVMAGGGE